MLQFDFPLSKKARTYLKFEQIFKTAEENCNINTIQETFCLLRCIVDYIDLVDGMGTIKLEILKDLEKCDSSLRDWLTDPEVDKEFVNELRQQIVTARSMLDSFTRQRTVLRDDPLISIIKQRFRTPCGINCYDTPIFEFWLSLPNEERRRNVKIWLHELECLRVPITTLLYLWRLCTEPQKRIAHQGFMQENIDNLDLVTITYDNNSIRGYPQVSGFSSRISVRFYPYDKGAPVGDIPFSVTYISGNLK